MDDSDEVLKALVAAVTAPRTTTKSRVELTAFAAGSSVQNGCAAVPAPVAVSLQPLALLT
jgi:hypothetical protein